jgi:hypothetical protein
VWSGLIDYQAQKLERVLREFQELELGLGLVEFQELELGLGLVEFQELELGLVEFQELELGLVEFQELELGLEAALHCRYQEFLHHGCLLGAHLYSGLRQAQSIENVGL